LFHVTVTRTIPQWLEAAGRLDRLDPALAARIRATLADHAAAHPGDPFPDAPLAASMPAAEAEALARLVPLGTGEAPGGARGGPAPAPGRATAAAAIGRARRRSPT
jgi:hypothetical protein